jgi:hypothetical protein
MRQMLLWLVIGMLGAVLPAAAGETNVYTCTYVPGDLTSYNSDDTSCTTPKTSIVADMNPCSKATLRCDTATCLVKFDRCDKTANNYVIAGETGMVPGTPADFPLYCKCGTYSPVQ